MCQFNDFLRVYTKKYPFSICCFVLIWILSLLPFFPETPLDDVAFIDKYTHVIMYGGSCLVLWIEYIRQHRKADYEKLFVWAWLMPTLMGGLLELLQKYCTGGCRNGDWLDFAANTLGVTLAAVIGLCIVLQRK
ncbi:MAG: VanZ family protein [Prevotella sp.]|nr:VanZ family protein [Prevotella sp.]